MVDMVEKTILEKQRENLKKAFEWEERIKELGHESEDRGIKATQELQKEDDKKQDKEKSDQLEEITRKRKFSDEEYKQGLIGWGNVTLLGIKLPKGYLIKLTQTKKGIVVWVRDSKNSWYARGIEPSFVPVFDMRAIEDKVMDAIDFADILAKPKVQNGFR